MSEYVFRYADGYGWKPGAYERENNTDHYGTLHEEIIRCADCERWPDDCDWNKYADEPDGFCAWARKKVNK